MATGVKSKFHERFREFSKWVYRNKARFGERCRGFCRGCVACDWYRLVEEVENMDESHDFGERKPVNIKKRPAKGITP